MNDNIDLQQQVEALQQYMVVCQLKIMSLQRNVDFLMHIIRRTLGDQKCVEIMDDIERSAP